VSETAAKKPIVIIGGGGHASVIIDILKQQKREIVAVISRDETAQRKIFNGINVFKLDSEISSFSKDDVVLVNGIGTSPGSKIRTNVNAFFKEKGYIFETVIASTAYVSPYAILEEGVQVFHGAIIQPGVYIGCNTIINTRAVVEHDVHLGGDNFVGPGAIICGQCKSGENVFIGAGAIIVQNVELGSDSSIMANALVVGKIQSNQRVYAARSMIK